MKERSTSICYLIHARTDTGLMWWASMRNKTETIASSPGMPFWARAIVAAVIVMIWLLIKYFFRKYPTTGSSAGSTLSSKVWAKAFSTIRRLRHSRAFILHTLFIWSMYLLQIYIGFYAMDGTDHLSVKAAFSVLTLATLAMIATPGGIGSFPIFVMQTLAIYGIAHPLGKAFGWLIWGVSTSIMIIAGCIALLLLPYMNKQKNESHSIDTRQDH
ncbi:MAG: hypothetical protein U0T56_10550 [Ferruginibacter sp.]